MLVLKHLVPWTPQMFAVSVYQRWGLGTAAQKWLTRMWHKAQRGQIDLGCPVREYTERLQQVAGVEIVPADAGLWLDSLDLDWTHRDPADRLIVALAHRRHLPIVTADKTIREWYSRTIW